MKRSLILFASIVLILSLLLSFGISGCTSTGGTSTTAAITTTPPQTTTPPPATTTATTPKPIPTLSSIAVTPASVADLDVGDTQLFTATGTYSDGSSHELFSVTWASDNPNVVTINRDGLAKAKAAGTAQITAALGGVTSSAVSITVLAPPPPPETTPPAPGEETTAPAETTTPTGPVVYVSVSVDSVLLVAAQPIAYTQDMTVEDVIKAAHEAFYQGSDSGYDISTNNQYSMYLVNKCWGIQNVPFLIINDAPLGAVAGAPNTVNLAFVAANDNIIICTASTAGAATPISLKATVSGDSVTVTATSWTLNMATFQYTHAPLVGAEVIDPVSGASLGTTDDNGQITITIPASGVVAIVGLGAINVASASTE